MKTFSNYAIEKIGDIIKNSTDQELSLSRQMRTAYSRCHTLGAI